MQRWLSLTVLNPPSADARARVLISIPKRTVKRAVQRNRLKRVLREAIRRDPFFGPAKVYRFKVSEFPAGLNLAAAQRTLGELHD